MRNKSMIRRLMLVLLVVSTVALCHAPVVHAAGVWIGVNNNFNDPNNWVDDDTMTGPKNPANANLLLYKDGAGYLNNIDITADIGVYSLGNNWGPSLSNVTIGSTGDYTLTFLWDTGLNNNKVGTGTLTFNAKIHMNGETSEQWWHAESDIIINNEISGAINDPSKQTLKKGGAATMYLNGVNTYDGPTEITQGTLAGTGSLTGSVLINNTSTFAPGAAPNQVGTFTLNNTLELAAGAKMAFDLAGTGASDKIMMSSSALTLNGQQFSDCEFTPLTGFGEGVYTLIDAGEVSGSLGPNIFGNVGGLTGVLSISGNNLVLTTFIGEIIPGDANGDRSVNEVDAGIMADHWLMAEGAGWGYGDFNGDEKVDELDAALMAANWGTTYSAAAVPEPGMLVLLVAAALSLAFLRRK